MRLRNIPGARDVIAGHEAVIKEEKQWKGRWDQVFENDHPIRLEIGMGKGQFLMQMALQNPDINYIGIERYSSVLLRALERMNALEEAPSNLRFVCMDASGSVRCLKKERQTGSISTFRIRGRRPATLREGSLPPHTGRDMMGS